MGDYHMDVATDVVDCVNEFLLPVKIALAIENGEIVKLYHSAIPHWFVSIALWLALKRAQRLIAPQFA